MFYNSDDELAEILKNSGTCIIAEKNTEKIEKLLKNPIIIRPGEDEGKSGITIKQVREVIEMTNSKAVSPRYFVFKDAEKLHEGAENAALKLLEEPKENYHFILQTSSPEALLPTIRSRAFIYAPLCLNALETPPEAEKDVFELSKRLLVADTNGIIDIAEEINKKKFKESSEKRDFTLKVIETTIELAEKSYFKTEKEVFTKKINGLILAYKAISENGNIKLQFVANLV